MRGIDVSHHQGEIDWPAVRAGGFTFAYVKATEGADHRDTRFERNWAAAGSAGLSRGAYHFFTFCTPGDAQAANFLDALPDDPNALAPAVDVEFTGNCRGWESLDAVRRELRVFLRRVEAARDVRPVLYVTPSGYERVVAGSFPGYALWVRSIVGEPDLRRDDRWLLWQFADRGRVRGVPTLVDLDVLHGTAADLPRESGTFP